MTDVIPPQDLAAEEAVLGSVLLSDVAMTKLIVDVRLSADMFYRQRNGEIWDAMVALAMADEPIDLLTVRARLESQGIPEQPGELDILTGAVPAVGHVLTYGRRIATLAEWRKVQLASLELQGAVNDQDRARRRAAEAMLTSAERGGGNDTFSPEALAEDVWRHLEGEEVPTWATPWPTLNEAMGGGLRSGETTLVGGWTSHGKSVVLDQMLRWCVDHGARVHLYINEGAVRLRALRLVSAMSDVEQHRLTHPGRMSDRDRSSVTRMLAEGFPFGITQVTDWPAEDVARDIRFRKWDVCALDILHRLPYREEADLREISLMLNAAAQTSSAHLLMAVHLNEARATGSVLPPPAIRDIRGSGMLKNDADNVMFVHREDEEVAGVAKRTNEARVYLAKCRNGYLKSTPLDFDADRLRFLEPVGAGWSDAA